MDAYIALTRSAFAVYLLMARNENGYEYDYSPQAIENLGIMTKGTVSKARQELEEKGYIEDGCFYVQSKKERIEREPLIKEKEHIDQVIGQS